MGKIIKSKYYNLLNVLIAVCITVVLCSNGTSVAPDKDIVVLYENDVHCAVDGYAKFAALYSDYIALTPYVTKVSSGDFLQGDIIGSLTSGDAIVKIMNKVGYDYVTLGNHEFDYGVSRMNKLLKEELNATVVNANFCHYPSMKLCFQPYAIKEYGNVKVAYIGLTTAATLVDESPLTFQDKSGRKIYDFMGGRISERTNRMVEKARGEGADYVILLCHLGNEPEIPGVIAENALSVIHNTKGIDAVCDAHSHSVIHDSLVVNAEGKNVHYTSTGTKFKYIGTLTIGADGNISTKLVDTAKYLKEDDDVKQYVTDIYQNVTKAGNYVVGHTDVVIPFNDAKGERAVRSQECGLGNFFADSYRSMTRTDVAVITGGGLRESIKAGDITYNDILAVTPFGNTICTATMTGQQLLDALEYCSSELPGEAGRFAHVSGMRYSVDTSVKARFVMEDNMFVAVAEDSPRRVKKLEIQNQATGEYENCDPDRTYTITSLKYTLMDMGNEGAFRYASSAVDFGNVDVDVTIDYIRNALGGKIPSRYAAPEGRIVIE